MYGKILSREKNIDIMKKIIIMVTLLTMVTIQCMEEQPGKDISVDDAVVVPIQQDIKMFPPEFLAIQKIRDIERVFADKASADTNCSYKVDIDKVSPGKLPFYDQTKQGLYLVTTYIYPALGTPYGRIALFGSFSDSKSHGCKDLTYQFMRYLTLKFLYNSGERPEGATFYRAHEPTFYTSNDNSGHLKHWIPITQNKLNSLRGTNTLIYTDWCEYCSVYEIEAIDGMPVPKLIEYKPAKILNYYEYKEVKKEYKALKQQYKQRINPK